MLELTHCELAGLNDATRIDVLNVTGNCTVYVGDCVESLRMMPDKSVHCCVTSPPYWRLRDYGVSGQLGLEKTPEEYVAKMVEVFREVRRVLRDDGTCWVNLGDSYAANRSYQVGSTKGGKKHSPAQDDLGASTVPDGLKPKDLVGIPWRVAFALQADGWYLRQDIIWAKPNPMPESVTDRCTKSHEYIFLMSKSAKYWYDADAISEDALTAGKIVGFTPNSAIGMGVKPTGNMIAERGKAYVRPSTRNRRSVWHISTRPYKGAHFATFPPALIEPCIKAGCPEGGTVLDPFGGSGTTGRVASDLGRKAILCELNTSYVELIKQRLTEPAKPLKKRTRDRLARGVEGTNQK